MAFKKNKRRFDPRYFMDEKTEEPLKESGKRPSLRIPGTDPAADRWHSEQEQAARDKEEEKRKASGPIDDNAGRYGQVPEGLENVTPENIEIVARAFAQIFANFSPAVLIAMLGQQAYDAIKVATAPSTVAPPEEELDEILDVATAGLSGLDQGAGAGLYSLVDDRIKRSLQKIKDNAVHLGDVHLLKNLVRNREDITEEQKNLIRILDVLGKTQKQWLGQQVWETEESEDSEV
tara:strand:+ start:134 stop:835 length:702 start_codon:yes stop_codon:yes gene_type:complete